MKIGFYSPYLDTFGGGERYLLTLASYLSARHIVEIFWDEAAIKGPIARFLKIDLTKVTFRENIFKKPILKKLLATRNYDLIFFLSDGSIPLSLAKKNILHFQVPFTKSPPKTSKFKLLKFNYVICNSHFTKFFIDKTYDINSLVIYPPVDLSNFKTEMKEKIILSVGRFGNEQLHPKKQEILIEVFKEVYKSFPDWKLILAGQAKKEDYRYLRKLKKVARGLGIRILENITFSELKNYYSKSSIYWHATGFGKDELKFPEKMEHFGISTVEASASGAVPIVIGKGGQKEIIHDEKDGLLWQTKSELLEKTTLIIQNEEFKQQLSAQAIKNSRRFSKEIFFRSYEKLIA